MDNIFADIYYFFVPNRLVWKHWQNFMGESDQAWLPSVSYEIPQVTSPASTGWTAGTIADYMGIPTGVANLSVNALPFRAYAKICDDWFRSTVVQDPLLIPDDETTQTGSNGTNYIEDIANGGMPFIANKTFDYFTGALPSPQRGPAVTITLGSQAVVGNGKTLGLTDGTYFGGLASEVVSANGYVVSSNFGSDVGTDGSYVGSNLSKGVGVPTEEQLEEVGLEKSGLITAAGASVVSINELREAFQIQKYYEKLARGGDRYISILKEFFGVDSPDARLQRSEYLGGSRVPISIIQVVQTSGTLTASNGATPQGNTAAYSLTIDSHYDFDKSFVEHGYVIGCMVLRYDHTYQQGIEKMWSRKTNFDFYAPVFANLGEQAIKNKEIFAQGSDVVNEDTGKAYDEEVFGYQEAWAEYRYKANRVAGEMRSTATTPLDVWHFGDDYASLPQLSYDWLKEDKSNVDRALAVTSAVSNQFIANIFVENESIRPMPVYSIPGLIDHH